MSTFEPVLLSLLDDSVFSTVDVWLVEELVDSVVLWGVSAVWAGGSDCV